MKTKIVHRHVIPVDDKDHAIRVCGSSKVILVDTKLGEVCVWVEQAEPALETTERVFRVFGTGHIIAEGYHHKGSVVAGGYVWHVYERSTYPRD